MLRPSGDQRSLFSSTSSLVIWYQGPPSAGMTQIIAVSAAIGEERDLFSVGGPGRSPLAGRVKGELPHLAALDGKDPQVVVSPPIRIHREPFPIGRLVHELHRRLIERELSGVLPGRGAVGEDGDPPDVRHLATTGIGELRSVR